MLRSLKPKIKEKEDPNKIVDEDFLNYMMYISEATPEDAEAAFKN
jgi:hypothetical protein